MATKVKESQFDEIPHLPKSKVAAMQMIALSLTNCRGAKISKASRTDGSKSPKNNFNKVPRLWTCQTYSENMSSVLKSEAILFEALFFVVAKATSVLDVLTFLPSLLITVSLHICMMKKCTSILFAFVDLLSAVQCIQPVKKIQIFTLVVSVQLFSSVQCRLVA